MIESLRAMPIDGDELCERNDSPTVASRFALSIQVVKICCGSAHFAPKRIIVPLIQSADVVAAETLVSDLHPGAERTHRRKIFDRKADGFCGRGKATIAQRLPRPAPSLRRE
jgi:hypothetical protein